MLSNWWVYLVVAVVIGAISAKTQFDIDSAAYEALQLADARALADFQARLQKADTAVTVALNASAKDRAAFDAKLTAALNIEGLKDAQLARCLALRLPDSILQQLTR